MSRQSEISIGGFFIQNSKPIIKLCKTNKSNHYNHQEIKKSTMQSLENHFHDPHCTDINWKNMEDVKSTLREITIKFNIKFPSKFPTFTDFFEKLEARYNQEVELHQKILNDEKFIADLFPPLSQITNQAIFDESKMFIENNNISYEATDFLILISSYGGVLQNSRFFKEKFKIIFDSLQKPYPSSTLLNIKKDKKVDFQSYESSFKDMLASLILDQHTPFESKVKTLEAYFLRKIQMHTEDIFAKLERLTTRFNTMAAKLKKKNNDLKNQLANQMKLIRALSNSLLKFPKSQSIGLNCRMTKLFEKEMTLDDFLLHLNEINNWKGIQSLCISIDIDKLLNLSKSKSEASSLTEEIESPNHSTATCNIKHTQINTAIFKIDTNIWEDIGKLAANFEVQLRINNPFFDRVTIHQMAHAIKDPNAKIGFAIESFIYTDNELTVDSMEELGRLFNKVEALKKGMQFDVPYAAMTTNAAKNLCNALQRLKEKPKLHLNINSMDVGKKLTDSEYESLVNLLKEISNKSDLTIGLNGEKWTYEEAMNLVISRKQIKIKFSSNAIAEINDLEDALKNEKTLGKLELDFRSNNQANEECVEKLVNLISNMAVIKDLTFDLRDNSISIKQLEILKSLLANNKNYNILFNHLSSDYKSELTKLSDHLQNFSQICKLELDAANIIKEYHNGYEIIRDIHYAINQFQCFKLLKITEFSYSNYTNEQVELLATVFSYTQSIISLTLSFSKGAVGNTAFEKLADSLKEMSQKSDLTRLYLDFSYGSNQIFDSGAEKLAGALKNMKNLASLTLYFYYGNHCIGSRGVQKIAEALKDMTNLTSLILRVYAGRNRVGLDGEKAIEDAIQDKKISYREIRFKQNIFNHF